MPQYEQLSPPARGGGSNVTGFDRFCGLRVAGGLRPIVLSIASQALACVFLHGYPGKYGSRTTSGRGVGTLLHQLCRFSEPQAAGCAIAVPCLRLRRRMALARGATPHTAPSWAHPVLTVRVVSERGFLHCVHAT